jgi:hypothetical protein
MRVSCSLTFGAPSCKENAFSLHCRVLPATHIDLAGGGCGDEGGAVFGEAGDGGFSLIK